ncbi:MAG TPA: OmpA family protein [Bryobacteraceae bacterium]|nr:OmpA family protein [Bryobacteraceae bacterium]
MFRKCAVLGVLACILAALSYAQGLNTNASKDDWEEINFEFNSAVLSDGYPSLLRLADLLHQHSGYHVKVEGNTDNLGSDKYNEKLGLERANTVKDFLVKYGAAPNQIETTTRGKTDPKYAGAKKNYTKTDVARWMNRRVVMTVTDEQGKTVSAGGAGEAIRAIDQNAAKTMKDCCDDILKRLDKLDDIARMMQQLVDQNKALQQQVDTLKNAQAALQKQGEGLQGKVEGQQKPLTAEETGQIVEKKIQASKEPRFSLLGANVGVDDKRDLTFSGKGRFFAPFGEHFAFQAQAEYLYFRAQREGEIDFGLVDRIGNFQGGLFTSFKHVNIQGAQNGGTLGQGALTLDYIFKLGKVGLFGTKGFMNNAVIDTRNATFLNGQTNLDGSPVVAVAPNIFLQRYLSIVDQVGASTSLGLWGNNYVEANVGYLRSAGHADRPGGTVRFVFPIKHHIAFTAEGGVNETLLGAGNTGRAVFGIQWGDFMRPKDYLNANHAVPVDIPRVRYEVLTRKIHIGATPPVADAGPDQIGVPAGPITLNGSNSYDPNGEPLTYQWVQETGNPVSLSAATAPVTTFTAGSGQAYTFRLTVRNTDGLSASARVRVTTTTPLKVQILFFNADPSTIQGGQSSRLSWKILNADSATISPNIGPVSATGDTVTVSPAESTTYTLTAKNATSQDVATATVTVQHATPRILTCTAVPMTITQGESSRIIFDSLNADNVTITPDVGSVGKSGSVVVKPNSTTTYTISATNPFGSDTCTVAVQVVPGTGPRIVRFSASPLSIPPGGVSTLVWQVENATQISIAPNVGSVSLVGTLDVTLQQTTTYTITASNPFGTVSAQVTINVFQPPPIIVQFSADPLNIQSGGLSTLVWQTQNATAVSISPNIGSVGLIGTQDVTLTQTTTYTLTASNSAGQVTAQVTINVVAPPPPPPPPPPVLDPIITSFTANPPQSPSPGSPVVLTCLTQNATQVVISGVGVVDANGNLTVNPQSTTTYVCVATNSVGKQVSKNLTVPVGNGGGGGGGGPTIVITSSSASCLATVAGGTVVCETVVRLLDLNLTASSSAAGNTPLTFSTTSRNISSVVLNPNSANPSVQLSELFGDYFFDVTVTDSKGNKSTVAVDVRYIRTTKP